jgi:HK97 family phage prohead protease
MSAEIEGYALCWSDTAVIGGRPERFSSYCFREPVSARLLVAHDRRAGGMLASTGGTLQIHQDDVGLAFAAELDAGDPYARRTLAAIGAGSLTGCSFGFRTPELEDDEDGMLVRRARLTEITLCGNGAYQAGGVWAVDAEQLPPKLEALREAWHARSVANRPARISVERTAFENARRGSVSSQPQARAEAEIELTPIQRWARAHLYRHVRIRA